jgi:hypothetical protein
MLYVCQGTAYQVNEEEGQMKIHFYFWQGFVACMALSGLMQDWMGKEAYIREVQQNWMNTHWVMWLVILAIAYGSHIVVVALFNKRKGLGE